MSEQRVITKNLSPQARALLAELGAADGLPQPAAPIDDVRAVKPADDAPDIIAEVPVFLAPHNDAKAKAFVDMLGHIDDDGGAALVDEKAALAAAQRYRSEKRAAHIDFDDADTMSDMEAESLPPVPQPDPHPAYDELDLSPVSAPASGPDMAADDLADGVGADGVGADGVGADGAAKIDYDALLDDELFGDEIEEMEDAPRGLQGMFAKFKSGAGEVKKLIGVKNASTAYDAQSGASLLPFTIIRAVVLLLVAAVPPAVNLIVIQPQISDNSRKLTQIRGFEAQAVESKKAADKLARKLAALEQDARRRIDILMPNAQLENLFNRYTAALQEYDIALNRYNVSSLEDRNVVIGSRVQQASLVELDLEGRYDVYVDIRKIFVEQLKNVVVLNEVLAPQEDGVTLKINARMMVPTRRAYDSELDDPEKIKKRKEAAEKRRQEEARKAEEAKKAEEAEKAAAAGKAEAAK